MQQPLTLTPHLTEQVTTLFRDMETAYNGAAERLGLSCAGCTDICCDSYFLHYTYVEWAYLRQGFATMTEERRRDIRVRSAEYILQSDTALARGERPMVMCPLNEKELCILYENRPMICRLHGVPAAITRPDGRTTTFPGCFRCQEIDAGKRPSSPMERSELFRRMVELETSLRRQAGAPLPRVKMTIAHMLLQEPPACP